MPPGNGLIKPVSAVYKPPVAIAPQNAGLPIGLANVTTRVQPGNPIAVAPLAPAAPAAPAPAAPAAPAPDFNTLINADPNYINAQADAKSQNNLALEQLAKQFAQTSQSYQDNANAHGALFSGAAVHAQNYAAQANELANRQQAQNYLGAQHANYGNAWTRILQQLAGGS